MLVGHTAKRLNFGPPYTVPDMMLTYLRTMPLNGLVLLSNE